MINPTFLQTFAVLAEERNFQATAKRLHMTQPGVSQHLQRLEDYFETILVERGRGYFELTPAGEKVLRYGRSLFADHKAFQQELGDDVPTGGLCRFSSPGSFGMRMYTFLLDLNRSHPDLAIHYAYAPNPSVVRDVLDGIIDVGFVTQKPEQGELEIQSFSQETLCLIVPAKQKDVSFEGLMKLGFINHPDGFYYAGKLLSQNFPKQYTGMNSVPVRGFTNQIGRILEPVAMGLGFTALPDFAANAFPQPKKIRILNLNKKVVDPVYLIKKKHRVLPSRFQFVLDAFRNQ